MPAGSAVERKAFDVPVEGVEGVVGGDHGAMRGQERETNNVAAAEDDFGLRLRSDADDSALATKRAGDVEISLAIESQALRTAEAAEKCAEVAGGRNFVNAIETGSGWAGDVEISRGAEGKMIGGEGRFERGENENFTVGADFENCAAAIADVEIARIVERESGGDAHAFDPLHGMAVGGNAVDRAILAAGNEKIPIAIEGDAGGIHQ